MINDEYILTYFFGKNHKKLNKKLLNDIPDEIIEYLNNRYSDSTCLLETLERIKKHIDVHPICENCGKLVKYVGSTRMYLKSCGCRECELKVNYLHGSNTNLQKYGVDNVAKLNTIKEKQKQTNIQKYGTKCALQNNIVKEKTKQTNIQKYGTECAQSSIIVKNKLSISNKKFWERTDKTIFMADIVNRIDKTKRKNNTYGKSKTEDKSYLLLKEKYLNVKRQYKSKLYPFACDFYIPDLNLYIECNYFWMHGYKPYQGTKEDLLKLNNWKNHNTNCYKSAIETWTIRDIKKRNTAKQNNLNWLEFFSIQELKDWLEKQ